MSLLDLTPQKQYDLLTKVATIAGAVGIRKLITKSWKGITKNDPPLNPASPGVLWKEALLWGAVTGMSVGITKIALRRLTASYWINNHGYKPEDH